MPTDDGLSLALEQKLVVNDTTKPPNKKKKKSKGKSKAKAQPESFADRVTDGSPLQDSLAHIDRAVQAAQEEVSFNMARKKDRKTFCGHCGKHKDAGGKLQTCSRCKSINYCSAQCQKDHWTTTHKADCETFAHPPIAKNFNPEDRNDVPWPVDPIFMQGNSEGLGVWMTTSGDLSSGLQQAFEPVEGSIEGAKLQGKNGTPSYRRWANQADRSFGPELKKYIGSTLLGVRIVVQNRRKDGKPILVYGAQTRITVHEMMKDLVFPEDVERAVVLRRPVGNMLAFLPWTDYNKELRAAILEINGVNAPNGRIGADGEWVHPKPPTGDPWTRVRQWDQLQVVLSPGDFVVYRFQYQLGDGNVCTDAPDVITRAFNVTLAATVLANSSASTGSNFVAVAPARFDYIDEYYKPYYTHDADVFAAQRLGGRAAENNEMLKKMVPLQMKMMLETMTPANKKVVAERFKAMGYDIEEIAKLAG